PFPFHSVYSVEDHKKHLDWIRAINPEVLISVKVSTPADVDMVAVGSYYAGAHIVNLDGAYGGTGAAPDIAKKNIAMPIEYAITQVHDFLQAEGIRDRIVLMAGGGIRTPDDVLKAIALGADGVVIGTAELVAIDCVRCGNCERLRGCPIGIATTDPDLSSQLNAEWVCRRIVTMYKTWIKIMQQRLAQVNIASIQELRGRREVLTFLG
ncbi:glutamate synthase-related protein, partial [candidate division CSSED10-310 bacterium]